MRLLAFVTTHAPGRDRGQGLRLSDFVTVEQGHLHFHAVPIIVLMAMIFVIATGIWGLVYPNLANQPIPNRALLPIGVAVVIVIIWIVIARLVFAPVGGF